MEYSVLENGLDFVLMATNNLAIINENLQGNEANKRLMKYALLHLPSGIELIFKHKLLQEHWTYVFADMNKARKDALQSGEFKSVDSETAIERVRSFCDVGLTKEEVRDLRNLRNRRNKAEHFRLKESVLSIESSMHRSISILIRVIVDYYDLDSFTDEENELYSQIKTLLRQSQEHYSDAKMLVKKETEKMGMEKQLTMCPECHECFLTRGDGAKCIFCNYDAPGEEAAREYICSVLGISEYEITKDGGEFPQYDCPKCDNKALVYDTTNNRIV